jgi:hypothetical protein
MNGRGKKVEAEAEALLRAAGGFVHRNEPRMQGRILVRGGLPDFTLILRGVAHYVEVKHSQKTVMPLGNLTAPADGAKEGPGITALQAATLDDLEAAGARGYIYARLDSTRGSVAALVPWQTWRGWLAAGRRSVGPVDLAAAGVRIEPPADPSLGGCGG